MTSTDNAVRRGTVHTRVADGIGWIVFDNPSRRNALSVDMMDAIATALGAFDDDPTVAVVVLRGAGMEAFAAGADISEFAEQQASHEAQRRFDETAGAVFERLREMQTPSIAMISGYCLGGGLAIALGADIRIAARGSSYAIPAARLGIGYPLANTEALVQIVGPAQAAEILFSARRLDSAEALSAGLVNRVVSPADLEHAVTELAGSIAANAPLTIRSAKASIRASRHPGEAHLKDRAEQGIQTCKRSDDIREGQRAFMEKRAPQFTGK